MNAEDQHDHSIVLPTPEGNWRPFQPTRSVAPEVVQAIQRAARLAWQHRNGTRNRIVEQGRRSVERARQEAIAHGDAIDHEQDAVVGD